MNPERCCANIGVFECPTIYLTQNWAMYRKIAIPTVVSTICALTMEVLNKNISGVKRHSALSDLGNPK